MNKDKLTTEGETPEEILLKYETYVSHSGTPIFLKENVLLAMKEYAQQPPKETITPEERTSIYVKGACTDPKDGDMWDFKDGTWYYEGGLWFSQPTKEQGQKELLGIIRELLPSAEFEYDQNKNSASTHQEFLNEDRDLISRARKVLKQQANG